MDQKKAKEILGKQFELLAEVSKTCQPEELVEISKAMVLIANLLGINTSQKISVTSSEKTTDGDRRELVDTIQQILCEAAEKD